MVAPGRVPMRSKAEDPGIVDGKDLDPEGGRTGHVPSVVNCPIDSQLRLSSAMTLKPADGLRSSHRT